MKLFRDCVLLGLALSGLSFPSAWAGSEALMAARAKAASEQSRLYSNALTSILKEQAFFASGLDSYIEVTSKHNPMLERLGREAEQARQAVNEGRAAGLSAEEMLERQAAYHQAKTRHLKQVLGSVEADLYTSNSYLLKEWMDGALITTGKIVDDYVQNLPAILEPLLFFDLAGACKNAITQMVDSTYRVTFVNHAKSNYGATEAIAQYWWTTYFCDPVNKTNPQKYMEGLIGQGMNKLSDELKKQIMERMRLELASRTKKMSEEALKKKVASYGSKVVKGWVETPMLLIDIGMKYYLVGDAHLLFAETAPNEVLRIKQIRELVGDNETEINRCYFFKVYFLFIYKKELLDWPVFPEPAQVKAEPEKKITAVSMMKQAVPEADPFIELKLLVDTEKKIEKSLEGLNLELTEPPPVNRVLTQLTDSLHKLQKDDLQLDSYFSLRSTAVNGYLEALKSWRQQAEKRVDDANLSRDEKQERLQKINRQVNQIHQKLADAQGQADTVIRKGRAEFAIKMEAVYSQFNSVAALRKFQDAYSQHYQSFCSQMAATVGGVYQEPLRTSMESYTWLFDRPAKALEKALDQDQPSMQVLNVGPRVVHALDALQKTERNEIEPLVTKGMKQEEAWNQLFLEHPAWQYAPSERIMNHQRQHQVKAWTTTYDTKLKSAYQEIFRIYMDSGNASMQIAHLNRRMVKKLRDTRQMLDIALSAAEARVDLLSHMVSDTSPLAVTVPKEYRQLREDIARKNYTVLKRLFDGKSTPEEAVQALNDQKREQKEAASTEAVWTDLRTSASSLSEQVRLIAREGVTSIHHNRDELAKTEDAPLVGENDRLRGEAARVLKAYMDSSYQHAPIDLQRMFRIHAQKNIRFTPLVLHAPTRAQTFDNNDPDFAALPYGDLKPALNLVAKYKEFQLQADKADLAKIAATKVHLAGLAEIAKKVDAMENRTVTQAEKDALMEELRRNDEKTVAVYNSYGNNWRFWNSNEESELVLRIQRLSTTPKGGLEAARKKANDWLREELTAYEKEVKAANFRSFRDWSQLANKRWTLEGQANDLFKRTASATERDNGHKYDQDVQDRLARIQTLLNQKRPKN